MIVCWVLFSIAAFMAALGFVLVWEDWAERLLSWYGDGTFDLSITIGLVGLFLAVHVFIWNISCHIAHWVWMRRKKIQSFVRRAKEFLNKEWGNN